MSMSQTSIQAFYELDDLTLSRRERQVYEALREIAPATNKSVCSKSGLPINIVTARMNAMAKRNIVKVAYVQKDMYGRSAKHWMPTHVEQMRLV